MDRFNSNFKKHIVKVDRKQTSQNRDIENGLRLDRNERVTPFRSIHLNSMRNLITSSLLSSYPDPERLYNKIEREFSVNKDQIFLNNGVTEGIKNIFESFTIYGDKVIYPEPTFPMYNIYIKIFGLQPVAVKYNGFSFDFDKLLKSIDPSKKVLFFPNPNLPVEYYFDLDRIKILAEKCDKNNVICVIDEAYVYFGARTAIKLINDFENLIVMQSFSKAYGIAGLRLGVTLGNKKIINYLKKTMSIVETNGAAVVIAEYLLNNPEIVQSYVRDVERGKNYITKKLKKIGIKFHGGDYTNAILIFLDSADKVNQVVAKLKSSKIYIRGGLPYPFDKCLRVTLGPPNEMEKFLKAFTVLL